MAGQLTKGFCLFCSAIPRGYDIFKSKPKISWWELILTYSWTIKSDFLYSYKKNYFYKSKSLGKRDCLLYFTLDHWHEKVIYTFFTRNISEFVSGQVFFLFLSLKILSQKPRRSLSPSPTLKYISQEYRNYSFTYLGISQSGLILVMYPVMQIWIHKPNAKIRKFCTLNSYEK